jgi:23S rRNA pseudouridine2605 synthase
MKSVPKPPPGDRPLKTLERVLSKAGLGSRREAREWIEAGRVALNGEPVSDPDRWIDLERDEVFFDGRRLAARERVYYLLNKPAGYLTTYRHPTGRRTVFELLPEDHPYVFPVGRLDLETTGLLILTNDSSFAEKVANPEYKVPKSYRVEAEHLLNDEQLARLRDGVELDDGMTRPALVERVEDGDGRTIFDITISEGRNRQVRRMVEAIGSSVLQLDRIAVGPIGKADLEPGHWRELTRDEVGMLIREE